MYTVDGAILVNVHAVEAESNHERPYTAEVIKVQPSRCWRSYKDIVSELAKDNDCKSSIAIVLMIYVKGGAVFKVQPARNPRPECEEVCGLL